MRGYQAFVGSGDYSDEFGSFTEIDGGGPLTNGSVRYAWMVALPRMAPAASCPIVVVCHGGGGLDHALAGFANPAFPLSITLHTLLEHRFVVAYSEHGGGNTWGGGLTDGPDESLDRLHEFVTYLRARPETRTDVGVMLLGLSMGGCTALLYAINHPAETGAVYLDVPAVDPSDYYARTDTDTKSLMNESHRLDHPAVTWNGVTYPARGTGVNDPAWGASPVYDPSKRVADIPNVPLAVEYALDDATLNPATQAAFVAATNPDIVRARNIGQGHLTWIGDDADVLALAALAGMT